MTPHVTTSMTPSELHEYILANRMSYHRSIKAHNRPLYDTVKDKYDGVKNVGESFWLYCHGHDSTLKCRCGTKLLFGDAVIGYRTEKCKVCYEYDRTHDGILGTKIRAQAGETIPKCDNTTCDNPVTLRTDGVWSHYCSLKCRGQYNSLKSREKFKETNLGKYGVEHHRQNKEQQDKFDATILRKYGTTNLMANKIFSDKRDNTNMERYGVANPLSSPDIQLKVSATNIERFGYPNPSQNSDIQTKKIKTSYRSKDYDFDGEIIKLQGDEGLVIDHLRKLYTRQHFSFDQHPIPYVFHGKKHIYFPNFSLLGNVVEVKSDYTLKANHDINIAKFTVAAIYGELFLAVTSNKKIFMTTRNQWVNKLYEDLSVYDITQYQVIDGMFFDFYHAGSGTAIRIVDSRLHNDTLQDREFANITNLPNISCYYYHIGGLGDHYTAILSSIINKIKLSMTYISARKCTIKELSNSDITEFYSTQHIQGSVISKHHIALMHNNTIVAAMSFSKSQNRNKISSVNAADGHYTLTRFATNGRVCGGASKLLSYFNKTYSPVAIRSYSDNMYSNGGLYRTLGFNLIDDRRPDYKYSKIGSSYVENKSKYQLSKLIGTDGYLKYDGACESDIMKCNGYVRIYDRGMKTWEYIA